MPALADLYQIGIGMEGTPSLTQLQTQLREALNR